MRDIIYRGKTKDGEWEYGGVVIYEKDAFIITKEDFSWSIMGDRGDYDGCITPVILETVGQYTGLTDKNGKKIFEGDLLEWIDRIVAVVWFDFNAQFDSKFIRYCNDKIVTNFNGIEPSDWHECKVIGNVFDNPELLEVK